MYYWILILLIFCAPVRAQTFNAAPLLAMGNTGIAQQSLYSITNNPAGISNLERPQVGAAYQNHFLSTEIQSQAVFAALPFAKAQALGLSANSYGLKDVSSFLTLRGVFAKRFGQAFATSVAVNYHRYYVRNYQSDQTASLDLGFQYYLGDDLVLGALARNVTSSMFQDDSPSEYLPEEYGLGFTYRLSSDLQVSADIYYDILEQFDLRAGLSYWFDPRLVIRGGAASKPTQYFAGVGILVRKIQVDIASSFHPTLGTSPQLALSYGF